MSHILTNGVDGAFITFIVTQLQDFPSKNPL